MTTTSANPKAAAAHIAVPPTAVRTLAQTAPFQVPYSKLFLSKKNVRSKNTRTVESVRSLAALIDADGLLNDLQVSEERNAKGVVTGRFGVEAGGRRWMAIGLLISEKRLPADPLVGCKLVADGRATGVSLAENIATCPLHPADEFAAFAQLIAEGKTAEEVAAHFGVKVIDVQRRMKLAKVAPALMTLYRDNQISLDHMMAFATTDDQKRQLAVWKSQPEYNRTPHGIKRRLTEDEVQVDDARVKLIGLDRYKASGGTMRTDLFSEQAYLEDVGLVDLIVAEVIAEAEARARAEGWAWVEVFETMGYNEQQQFNQPPKKYTPETSAQTAERIQLQTKLEKLEDEYNEIANGDEADDDKIEAIDKQCDQIRARLDALEHSRLDTSGYDKSTLGAVVTTQSGSLKIMRGMMTAKDAKAETRKRGAVKQGAVRQGDAPATGSATTPEFSEKLTLDLTSHRTAAMQAALTRGVPVALALLADTLYGDVDLSYHASVAKISLKGCAGALEQHGTAMSESPAAKLLEAQRAQWEQVVPAGDERLTWLLRQPQGTVLALLAFCTALSVDLVQRRASPLAQADVIADALHLDIADWWSVGVDNFLAQVPKAKISAVVSEARGAEAAAPIAAMKKAEACAAAAAVLLDSRWLPAPLRLGTPAARLEAAANDAPSSKVHALNEGCEASDLHEESAAVESVA